MTNVYCFLDAFGESFSDIEKADCVFFGKRAMKKLVEKNSGKTLQQIYDLALDLLEDDFSRSIRLSKDLILYKSHPDGKNNIVINLCFDRDFIDDISKKKTIMKKGTSK